MAGVLAIILSTLNSFLFIASNTLSFDLLRNRFKNIVLSNRISIFAVGLLAIAMAHMFHGSFKEIWLVLGSYFSACLLVPISMGYLSPGRISDRLFVFSSLTSAAVMTAWRFIPKHEVLQAVDPFYAGVAAGLVILLLCRKGEKGYVARIVDR